MHLIRVILAPFRDPVSPFLLDMSVISIGKELTIVGALPPCPPPLPPFLHKVTSHVHPGSPGRLWVPLPLPPRKIRLTSHFEPSLSAPQRHPLLAQEPQPDLSSTTFLTPPNPHASCPIKRNALTSQLPNSTPASSILMSQHSTAYPACPCHAQHYCPRPNTTSAAVLPIINLSIYQMRSEATSTHQQSCIPPHATPWDPSASTTHPTW